MENSTVTIQNDIIFTFICPSIGLIGLCLNLISIFIISNFKEPLFFYLKMELIVICCDLTITVFKPIYYCQTCQISNSYFASFYYVVFNVYFASVFELSAILLRNLSALVCFLLISNYCRIIKFILKKSLCKMLTLVIFILSVILYSYQLFEYTIVRTTNINETYEFYYRVEKTVFGQTLTKSYIELVVMSFRDGFNVLALLCLSMFIILNTRMNLNSKKNLLLYSNRLRLNYFEKYLNYCNNKNIIQKLAKKENKQTLMVIMTCLNCLIGRLPILYFFIKKNIIFTTDRNTKYAALMVYFSYSVYFFIYYHSNLKFRKLFKLYFSRLFVGFLKVIKL